MSEAVRSFAEATGQLDRLLPLIARHLGTAADASCVIRLLSDDGRFLNPSALWSPEAELEPVFRRTVAAAPVRVDPGSKTYAALRESSLTRSPRVSLAELGVDLRPEHEHLRSQIEPGPLMMLALRNRDYAFGLAYLLRRPGEPTFESADDELVEDLGAQAAIALGTALRIRTLQDENAAFRQEGDRDARQVDHRTRRLDSLAALASGLAHDYDNLISVIQMCTNLRLEAVGDDEVLQSELEQVRQACERASELTPLLTVLAQRQFLQPELLDPIELLQQMRSGLVDLLDPVGELEIDLGDGGGPVCVDRPQFTEAVTHLVLNARSGLLPSGTVRLTVRNREVNGDDLIGVRPGAYVVISVEDDGAGLPPDIVARVSQPFVGRRASGASPGLGLSSVVAFARQSGGTLTVASRPGSGTTVSVFLPVVTDTWADDVAPRNGLDGIETILLAVADLGYRVELRSLLRRYGYQVLEVQSPRHAIDVATAFEEPIHLVVADASSPFMAQLAKLCPRAAALQVGLGADPELSLQRGQQESEILARVRRALTRGR